MSDFKFQEWERLSEKVTDGEADLRCVVEETEWLFRQCGEWWFAREAASVGCEGNWLFRPILAVSTSGDYSFPCAQMPREEMGRWLRNVGPDELREAYFRVWESPEEGNAAPFGAAWNRWDGWVYGIGPRLFGRSSPVLPVSVGDADSRRANGFQFALFTTPKRVAKRGFGTAFLRPIRGFGRRITRLVESANAHRRAVANGASAAVRAPVVRFLVGRKIFGNWDVFGGWPRWSFRVERSRESKKRRGVF